jgi:hypothetical protein
MLINYGAHAATIKTEPGDTFFDVCLTGLAGVLIPYSGAWKAVRYFRRFPVFIWGDEFEKALWAGALCTVARDWDWKPTTGTYLMTVPEEVNEVYGEFTISIY